MAKLFVHSCVHCGARVRFVMEYTTNDGESIGEIELTEEELAGKEFEESTVSGEICVPCLYIFHREIYYQMKEAGLIPAKRVKAVEEDHQY